MQECKKPKVEMYKPIWGLMFKYDKKLKALGIGIERSR
jgi:hypothetical protein